MLWSFGTHEKFTFRAYIKSGEPFYFIMYLFS